MNASAQKRLRDALLASQAARRYVAGTSFEQYETDDQLQAAVERRLEIVGEALSIAAKLLPGLDKQIPELARMVSLRNRVINGYDTVDHEIVWDIVQTKLPALESILSDLISGDEFGATRLGPS